MLIYSDTFDTSMRSRLGTAVLRRLSQRTYEIGAERACRRQESLVREHLLVGCLMCRYVRFGICHCDIDGQLVQGERIPSLVMRGVGAPPDIPQEVACHPGDALQECFALFVVAARSCVEEEIEIAEPSWFHTAPLRPRRVGGLVLRNQPRTKAAGKRASASARLLDLEQQLALHQCSVDHEATEQVV